MPQNQLRNNNAHSGIQSTLPPVGLRWKGRGLPCVAPNLEMCRSGSVWHRSSELAAAAEVLDREAHGYEVRYRAERLPESKVVHRNLKVLERLGTDLESSVPGTCAAW